jgi:hypothetical protein
VLVEQSVTPSDVVTYVGGFLLGLAAGWAMDRYAFVLQTRIVVGWAEHWCKEATGAR